MHPRTIAQQSKVWVVGGESRITASSGSTVSHCKSIRKINKASNNNNKNTSLNNNLNQLPTIFINRKSHKKDELHWLVPPRVWLFVLLKVLGLLCDFPSLLLLLCFLLCVYFSMVYCSILLCFIFILVNVGRYIDLNSR